MLFLSRSDGRLRWHRVSKLKLHDPGHEQINQFLKSVVTAGWILNQLTKVYPRATQIILVTVPDRLLLTTMRA